MKKEDFPNSDFAALKFGFHTSLVTCVLTVITFGIAVGTPPLSGPFCSGNCFQYPYAEIASRFPRDYYWMFPAILLSVVYLFMMSAIHAATVKSKKVFSNSAYGLALISTIALVFDYFIQVSVIQPSILAGETDGIALLTQFNPHGIFIVLEEIGFIFMNLSFLLLVPVFSERNPLHKAIRITAIIAFLLMIMLFIAITWQYGLQREYRFEVAVITVTWLQLIIISGLIATNFRKQTIINNR